MLYAVITLNQSRIYIIFEREPFFYEACIPAAHLDHWSSVLEAEKESMCTWLGMYTKRQLN